ncbi:probable protein phosphatase 2C 8 [Amaranthus tricolor]|uniref:probable protein phosphatase 2C 8 n=1 Tax=Amaranthus tricolor TaxID=29722 RepID=UPI0025871A7A|nr:probable protein phosphatase 2C 8 [Amaranthus tricolor]
MLRNILNNAEVQDISTNTLQGVIPAEAFGVVSSEGKTMEKPSTVSLSHGAVSVIGRRRSMEDAVTVVPANDHDLDQHLNYDFFGVYDGNGVAYRVTQKCKERLHHVVAEQFAVLGAEQWENVMATSFARMDEEIARDECSIGVRGPTIVLDELVGSTALVVLVGSQEIVVANCGDSKAVLSCDGNVLTLSSDTKLTRQAENVRNLESTAVSGDTKNVKPNVISTPEVRVHKRTKTDNFLVIGSDGLWDVVGVETACDIVRKCCSGEVLSKRVGVIGNCAAASAAMLVELALARKSKDNISVIVVELQHVNNANTSTQCT